MCGRNKQKLLFIIIASVIVYFDGYQITNIGTFFNVSVNLGYFALPFTLFAIGAGKALNFNSLFRFSAIDADFSSIFSGRPIS